MHHRPLLFLVALILSTSGLGGAEAATRDEWQLGAQALGSGLATGGDLQPGGGLGLDLQTGLRDSWALRFGLEGHGLAAADATASGVWGLGATAGATYTVDVVRWLPFVEMGLSTLMVLEGAESARQHLGFQVGLGADFLLDRRWAVGGGLRYALLPLHMWGGGNDDAAQLVSVAVRGSYRFY